MYKKISLICAMFKEAQLIYCKLVGMKWSMKYLFMEQHICQTYNGLFYIR